MSEKGIRKEINRRDFLKTTSVAGAGSIAVGRVQAVASEETDFRIGSVQFVEAVLEHRDAPPTPRLASDSRASYVVDEKRGRLTLAGAPLEQFEDGSTVLYDGTYRTVPTRYFRTGSSRQIVVQSDFRRLHEVGLELESDYENPEISFEKTDTEGIRVTVDGRSVTVPAKRERTIQLRPRKVKFRGRSQETREVPNPHDVGPDTVERPAPGPIKTGQATPSLTVRNSGKLDVYGADDAWILPLGTDDPYAQNTVRSMLQTNENATIDSEDDLLVAPIRSDNQ